MPTFAIERILPGEEDALRPFVRTYWQEIMPNAPLLRDPIRRAVYFVDHFRLEAGDSWHWWAMVDGTHIGFAKVDLAQDHDGRWAQVCDFYIIPTWRRQGWGRAFATALMALLRAEGIVRVDLNVRQDNPDALAFWQALGFDLALYRLRCYLD